jgi:hypothetical protein
VLRLQRIVHRERHPGGRASGAHDFIIPRGGGGRHGGS